MENTKETYKSPSKKLQEIEQLVIACYNKVNINASNISSLEDLQKETKKNITKMKNMIEDLKEIKEKSGDGFAESMTPENLELAVKEFILNSDDILELIEKVSTNVSEHYEKKEQIEKYVDKRFKYQSKAKNLFLIFLTICIGLGLSVWLYLSTSTQELKIPANTEFYSYKNNKTYQSEVPFVVKNAKIDGNKAYFTIGKKRYYIIIKR